MEGIGVEQRMTKQIRVAKIFQPDADQLLVQLLFRPINCQVGSHIGNQAQVILPDLGFDAVIHVDPARNSLALPISKRASRRPKPAPARLNSTDSTSNWPTT